MRRASLLVVVLVTVVSVMPMLVESVAEAQPGGSYALPAENVNVARAYAMPGERLLVLGSYRDASNASILFTRLYDAAGALLWEKEGRAYFNDRYGPSMASDGSVFLALEGIGLSRIALSGVALWTVPLETTLDAPDQGFWLDEGAGELYYFDTDGPNRGGIEDWHLYALDASTGATLRKMPLGEQGIRWIRRYFYSGEEFAVFEHPVARLDTAAISYIRPDGVVTSSTEVGAIADTPTDILPAVEYGPEQRVYLQTWGYRCGSSTPPERIAIGRASPSGLDVWGELEPTESSQTCGGSSAHPLTVLRSLPEGVIARITADGDLREIASPSFPYTTYTEPAGSVTGTVHSERQPRDLEVDENGATYFAQLTADRSGVEIYRIAQGGAAPALSTAVQLLTAEELDRGRNVYRIRLTLFPGRAIVHYQVEQTGRAGIAQVALGDAAGELDVALRHPLRGDPPRGEAENALKVVLIGDSYSAGNGARSPGGARSYWGPQGCYRSHFNWADKYVYKLIVSGHAVRFVNRACSGAEIKHVWLPQAKEEKRTHSFAVSGDVSGDDPLIEDEIRYRGYCTSPYPDEEFNTEVSVEFNAALKRTEVEVVCDRQLQRQIDSIDEDTDLVLMTMGGNDKPLGNTEGAFASIVKQCFTPGFRDPGDCRSEVEKARDNLEIVKANLSSALRLLRDKLRPDARVVLVSYPYLEKNDDYTLDFFLGPIRRDRYRAGAAIRELGRLADTLQQEAVDDANAGAGEEFVFFVDGVKDRFKGREPDASSTNPDRFLYELFDTKIPLEWYHPNPRGHGALADVVAGGGAYGAGGLDRKASVAASSSAESDPPGEIVGTAVPQKPNPWAGGPYVTTIGTPVELDASGSLDADGVIVSYEWDLDGDGAYDTNSPTPTYRHVFAEPYDGVVAVRVTDDSGLSDVATATAHASVDGDEVPAEWDNCPDLPNHGQDDYDGDGIGDVCDPEDGYPREDLPGVSVTSDLVAPVAVNDGYGTRVGESLIVKVSQGVLANDVADEGDTLSVDDPGSTTVNNGDLQLAADGSFTYTPASGFIGDDWFWYRAITDDGRRSEPALATIRVVGATKEPVAIDDAYAIQEGATLRISTDNGVLKNDLAGDGSTLRVHDPNSATVSHGTLKLEAGGSFSYAPERGFTGEDTFSYQVNDGVGVSEPATVTITVNPVAPSQPPDSPRRGQAGDSIGLVDASTGRWYLETNSAKAAATAKSFFYGNPGDLPIAGDWDGDGDATPGLYRQSDGFFYSRNSNTTGIADAECFAGDPSDVPIAGDWDGDGDDNLGIYRPSEQKFYLFTSTCTGSPMGAAQISFLFGNPGDKPVAGDWDGDGIDEVGLHRESTGFFYWRNTLDTGVASDEIFFGDPGDRFVSGDWGVVDGKDTPAVFRPSDVTFYFRHTLTQGTADSQYRWIGASGNMLPVAGQFAASR